MYKYQKLAGRIVEKYHSIFRFCHETGRDYQKFRRMISGTTTLSLDDAFELQKTLDINDFEFVKFFGQ